jgi:modulator of FtsH protease
LAYEASEWSDLFVAAAGASAALAGLLFVAVSINVERILQYRGLPERALEALALLLGVLVISIIGLIPGQDHVALGIELLLTGLAAGGAILVFTQRQSAEPHPWRRVRLAMAAAAVLLPVIGGATVLIAAGGGLYWIAAAVIWAIIVAVANAWVLLVEILR